MFLTPKSFDCEIIRTNSNNFFTFKFDAEDIVSRFRLYSIVGLLMLNSCTNGKTQDSTALLLSNDLVASETDKLCRVEQINYIKQKICDDALNFSATQLLEYMFAIGDNFFDGLAPCK